MNNTYYIILLFAAVLVAIVLCFNAQRICSSLDLMDIPVGRKKHAAPTPLMGGVVLLGAFLPVALVCIVALTSERWLGSLLIWVGCVSVMALVGLCDDRYSLTPRLRLLISFAVFASAAAADPTFNVRVLDFNTPPLTLGLGAWWLAMIFTIICCVGLLNAVNMADGKNGLVLALSICWIAILATRAVGSLLPLIGLFAAVLMVLFVFNMMGKLFLGDGGAYAIATAIGLLAIAVYNTPGIHSLRAVSADELVLIFAVPVADSFRLTYKRLRQGRSPMSADRDHLHHHLQNKFGWPLGLIIYLVMALGLGSVVIVSQA